MVKEVAKSVASGIGAVLAFFTILYLITLRETWIEEEKLNQEVSAPIAVSEEIAVLEEIAVTTKKVKAKEFIEAMPIRESVLACLKLISNKYAPTVATFIPADSGAKVVAQKVVLTIQNFYTLDLGVATREYYAICTTSPNGKTTLVAVLAR